MWCTAADGHRTYSAVRPMFSFEVVVVSFLVQRSFEVDLCMSPRARVSRNFARNFSSSIFSRMARDASSNRSWRQLSRFWYRHPYLSRQGWSSSRLVIAWWQLACLIAPRHCFVTVASMDGFHCSSSCTGGMTWSGSDVSGELSRVAITCHPRVIELPVAVDGRLSPAPRARLDRAWFT